MKNLLAEDRRMMRHSRKNLGNLFFNKGEAGTSSYTNWVKETARLIICEKMGKEKEKEMRLCRNYKKARPVWKGLVR